MTTTSIILNFDGLMLVLELVDHAIHLLPTRLFGFVLPLSMKIWKWSLSLVFWSLFIKSESVPAYYFLNKLINYNLFVRIRRI